jgi:hypothetical protein
MRLGRLRVQLDGSSERGARLGELAGVGENGADPQPPGSGVRVRIDGGMVRFERALRVPGLGSQQAEVAGSVRQGGPADACRTEPATRLAPLAPIGLHDPEVVCRPRVRGIHTQALTIRRLRLLQAALQVVGDPELVPELGISGQLLEQLLVDLGCFVPASRQQQHLGHPLSHQKRILVVVQRAAELGESLVVKPALTQRDADVVVREVTVPNGLGTRSMLAEELVEPDDAVTIE